MGTDRCDTYGHGSRRCSSGKMMTMMTSMDLTFNVVSHQWWRFWCSTDPYILFCLTIGISRSQLHTSAVCQPQPIRPHRFISRGRASPMLQDSSPHRMLGIPMKTQQYGAPQLINIESRFVSKVLPEHFLGEFYSPRARLEVPRNWSRMIQKVCAVFDLCGLGLVFDGSKRAASFCEVYVILTAHCPWSETSSCEWCQCHCAIEEYVCELWSLLFPVQSILCRFCGSWVARISLERT